ncbi:MAG: hypothetical protein J6N21_04900 [Butyrivibrio sp.]|nr:hypothetical protein [Butyrivibrio sp.]MBP3196325.1 hypothetical protein [Butyrivibrio sp.]
MGENGEDKYYYNNYNYNKAHNDLDKHVNMASVALVLGLISIPFCFFMYTGIILGGIAITFAILSKGTAKKLLPQAKKAIIYGSIGIVLGYGIIISSVHTIMTDPGYYQQLNTFSEQYYGVSFDEMLKEVGITR